LDAWRMDEKHRQECDRDPEALNLSDMAGNCWEWCNDWHVCNLGATPVTDPVGPASGTHRVLRGGSWRSNTYHVRCAYRCDFFTPNYSGWRTGVRAARTANPLLVKSLRPPLWWRRPAFGHPGGGGTPPGTGAPQVVLAEARHPSPASVDQPHHTRRSSRPSVARRASWS
jgi:hypothetical protein